MAEVRISFHVSPTGQWSLVSFTVNDDYLTELIDVDYGHDLWRLPTSYQPAPNQLPAK